MDGKNKENAGNDVDNGVGSCCLCNGNHYVKRKVMATTIPFHLQSSPTYYSTCPICVVQNATTTNHGPVTNSNDRGQLHQ
jgi:hypothetical protein